MASAWRIITACEIAGPKVFHDDHPIAEDFVNNKKGIFNNAKFEVI